MHISNDGNGSLNETEGNMKMKKYTETDVEPELNYLKEFVVEDLKSELGGERTISFLNDLKNPRFKIFPRWEDLVDGTIDFIAEEYELEEEYS